MSRAVLCVMCCNKEICKTSFSGTFGGSPDPCHDPLSRTYSGQSPTTLLTAHCLLLTAPTTWTLRTIIYSGPHRLTCTPFSISFHHRWNLRGIVLGFQWISVLRYNQILPKYKSRTFYAPLDYNTNMTGHTIPFWSDEGLDEYYLKMEALIQHQYNNNRHL